MAEYAKDMKRVARSATPCSCGAISLPPACNLDSWSVLNPLNYFFEWIYWAGLAVCGLAFPWAGSHSAVRR